MKTGKVLSMLLAVAAVTFSHSFISPTPRTYRGWRECKANESIKTYKQSLPPLHMYNLPQGGGGGGGNNDGLQEVLGGVATIAAITLFFLSPLGSIFFAITNSLFLFALLLPVFGFVAFQAWQFLNTVSGSCPNCGSAVKVLKDQTPSICFTCGSVVQASDDKSTIEFAPNDAFASPSGGSMFDSFFGEQTTTRTETYVSQETFEDKEKQFRRERTVIDVEVEDD